MDGPLSIIEWQPISGGRVSNYIADLVFSSITRCQICISWCLFLKSDNLQYDMLVCWADRTNDLATKCLTFQVFFFIISYGLRALKTFFFHSCNSIKTINWKGFCKENTFESALLWQAAWCWLNYTANVYRALRVFLQGFPVVGKPCNIYRLREIL